MTFKEWFVSVADKAIAAEFHTVVPLLEAALARVPGAPILDSLLADPQFQAAAIAVEEKGVGEVADWMSKEWAQLEAWMKAHVSKQVADYASKLESVVVPWSATLVHAAKAAIIAGTFDPKVKAFEQALLLP